MRELISALGSDAFTQSSGEGTTHLIDVGLTSVALWPAMERFTPIRPEEFRTGKIWRVTAGGTWPLGLSEDHPVKLIFNPFIDDPATSVFGSAEVQAMPGDPQSWFAEAIIVCRTLRDNTDTNCTLFAGGHVALGRSAGAFATDVDLAVDPTIPHKIGIAARCLSLSGFDSELPLATQFAFIQSLN